MVAGAVGFEPTIHDTKNRCLTTWPRPKYHLARPIGDKVPANYSASVARATKK